MLPRRGRQGVIWWFKSLVMASMISNLMPEYPCKRVLILTSMAALVAEAGSVVFAESSPLPKIPAFKNL